jgi:hypothetical protein
MSKRLDPIFFAARTKALRAFSRVARKGWFLGSEDREFLERRLFRIFWMERLSVLSIGCHPASRVYQWLLPSGRYHTLDIDPANAEFGAPSHTVGDCREIPRLLPGSRFHLVLFNGILGYGINEPDSFLDFQRSAHAALVPNGWLIVGFNDIPARKGQLIDSMDPSLFRKSDFLGSIPQLVRLPTHNRHTFAFFRKVGGE